MSLKYTLLPLLALFLFSCMKEKGGDGYEVIERIRIGDKIPEFEVSGPGGATFSSREFIGRQSLLVFFITTCPDCQKVLPVLNEAWEEIKEDESHLMIAVSRAQSESTVSKYWSDNNYTIPWYMDEDRSVFELFANSTVPRIYIIDATGTVTDIFVEKMNVDVPELISLIQTKSYPPKVLH